MELTIDKEFEELIPPLSKEEYEGLEENIVENGFNPAFPVIVWNNTIVDGHNRYHICQKHNIDFVTIEQNFSSRSAAKMWIIENQLARRNINNITRNDLLGRWYNETKLSEGRPTGQNKDKKLHQNDGVSETAVRIAKQAGVGQATVERAAKITEAIDIITANTGISRAEILTKKINYKQEDLTALAKYDKEFQIRAMEKVTKDNEDIESAIIKTEREDQNRRMREIEENRKKREEEARVNREKNLAIERERLEKERLEKVRLEKERLEKERIEQEQERLEKIEHARKVAEEKARTAAEQEKLRSEAEKQERLEKEKLEKERLEKQKLEKERLEKLRVEQEKKDEEKLQKIKLEQEQKDKHDIEEIVKIEKAELPVSLFDPYVKCACAIMGKIDIDPYFSEKRDYAIDAKKFYSESLTFTEDWSGKLWIDLLDAGRDMPKLTTKIMQCCSENTITEAFIITRNETNADWFKQLMCIASAVVFPVGVPKSNFKSHALIYIGKNCEVFLQKCESFGWGVILNKI